MSKAFEKSMSNKRTTREQDSQEDREARLDRQRLLTNHLTPRQRWVPQLVCNIALTENLFHKKKVHFLLSFKHFRWNIQANWVLILKLIDVFKHLKIELWVLKLTNYKTSHQDSKFIRIHVFGNASKGGVDFQPPPAPSSFAVHISLMCPFRGSHRTKQGHSGQLDWDTPLLYDGTNNNTDLLLVCLQCPEQTFVIVFTVFKK